MFSAAFRQTISTLTSTLRRAHCQWLSRSDRAAGFIEYALLLALIAAVVVGAAAALGQNTAQTMNNTASSVIVG